MTHSPAHSLQTKPRPDSSEGGGRPSYLSRRRFLKGSSGLLLGAGLAHLPGSVRGESGRLAAESRFDAWQQLARSLQGTLLRAGDNDFDGIAKPWNLRFASILPAAIARCVSTDDVRTCILWAQSNDIPLVARSGGHSYAGYSTTTGLLIDLSQINQVSFDADTGLARLGGGARNADVYSSLRQVGQAITHGRCGAVGVAGLVLGGGIGFNQRLKGLTCDQLVETEVLTAAGDLLRCNQWENADLFWACRGGGGGNFGINVSLTFQTFPVDTMTAFQITWTDKIDALAPAALDLLPMTTDRLGCKLSLINVGGDISMELLGQLHGAPTELRRLLSRLYEIGTPSQEVVQSLPYWDAQDVLSEEGTPAYSHERSRYVFQPLPPEGTQTILNALRAWPGTSGSATWKMFLAGGAVADVQPDATAFVHRAAQMISSIELDWTEDDSVGIVARNERWLADFHGAMRRFSSNECYQNFIDETQMDFLHAYYGSNLSRLVQVKQQFDPLDVFHFPQGIPLSLGALAVPRQASERAVRRLSPRNAYLSGLAS
jgi:FAD/FMN-containing dehydrogenase